MSLFSCEHGIISPCPICMNQKNRQKLNLVEIATIESNRIQQELIDKANLKQQNIVEQPVSGPGLVLEEQYVCPNNETCRAINHSHQDKQNNDFDKYIEERFDKEWLAIRLGNPSFDWRILNKDIKNFIRQELSQVREQAKREVAEEIIELTKEFKYIESIETFLTAKYLSKEKV